ncbi:OmpA family protein [bacterium]|nr:OmpA family protein [bacterium]MBU1993438.1 OmpA family protein [bacterium]
MKKIITVLASSLLVLSLNASQEVQNSQLQQETLKNEFAYIQPVSVEEAPTQGVQPKNDADGDGIADAQDRCPNTPQGEKVDKLGCLIQKDSDGDGVPNEADKCPNTQKNITVDQNGCETDSDNDGIVDSKDKCPATSKDFMVDGYGCPQAATLKVNFAPGKYALTDEIMDELKEFAMFLKENDGYQIILFGYTDNSGDPAKNKILSQNRADSIKEALTRYGINTTRLTAIGKGALNPIASNDDEEGRAKNRRIEVELIQ